MMGRQTAPAKLFYDFDLESHIPADHLLRRVDRFLDLGDIRARLRPFYSHLGRPSIDPELVVRMLLIGYPTGIRSERRLCEEVHVTLAHRWFCQLGLDGRVPDHSTFSKYRQGPSSATAIYFGWSSRASSLGVSRRGWWAVRGSRSMPVSSWPMSPG